LRAPKLPLNTLPLTPDPFEARSRLEQCHRDNANLRRDLKDAADHLTKVQAQLDAVSGDTDLVVRLQAAEDRVNALLQDLQWRDDTIAALERELIQRRPSH
jgi:septal ring factor EnvC (AmiA/AmiB activator)